MRRLATIEKPVASDSEDASAEAVKRARCMESHKRAGYVGVHGIIQSAVAHGAKRPRAVGLAKRASSVHKEHEELALAESYRDNRPLDKEILETLIEFVPPPRRWRPFGATTKPALVRVF